MLSSSDLEGARESSSDSPVTVHSGYSWRRTDQLSRYGKEKVHER